MSTKKLQRIRFEESSGDVFADLGVKDAGQLQVRSQLGYHVFRILEARKMEQREISSLLGIAPPDLAHLMNGHFNHFSTEKLLGFLKRLERKVTIKVSPYRRAASPARR